MIQSYDTMPLGIYEQVIELLKVEGLTEDEVSLALVALLTGKSEEELEGMPFTEFRTYADKLGFLFEQPKPSRLRRTYNVGEFRCKVARSASVLTWGQYKDVKEFLPHYNERPELLLSALLVPIGKEYCKGYDVGELHEAIRQHLMITDVQAITAFFLQTLLRSTKNILISLAIQMRLEAMRAPKEQKEGLKMLATTLRSAAHSLKSGVGSTTPTASLGLPTLLGRRLMAGRAPSPSIDFAI